MEKDRCADYFPSNFSATCRKTLVDLTVLDGLPHERRALRVAQLKVAILAAAEMLEKARR